MAGGHQGDGSFVKLLRQQPVGDSAATKHLECLYNARVGRNPADPFCQAQGYPAGPTFQGTPHAASEDGGIGLSPQQVPVNFLDNHDLPRFLFEDADETMLRTALAFLYTWDGIPCLYYGTEQLFDGGVDPRNREDMHLGNTERGFPPFDTTNAHFAYVQDLIAIRKANPALRRGTVEPRWATEVAGARRDAGIFAFERIDDAQTVLVVLNTSEQDSETCAPVADGGACMATGFPSGTTLVDVAPGSDGATFAVGAGGVVTVSVPPHGARVLVAQ